MYLFGRAENVAFSCRCDWDCNLEYWLLLELNCKLYQRKLLRINRIYSELKTLRRSNLIYYGCFRLKNNNIY